MHDIVCMTMDSDFIYHFMCKKCKLRFKTDRFRPIKEVILKSIECSKITPFVILFRYGKKELVLYE